MADILDERFIIQQEQTQPQAALSEDTMSKIGASVNFILHRLMATKRLVLNGSYNSAPVPNVLIDGVFTYPYAFSLIDVVLSSGLNNGTSGTLELDIKWRAQNTGAWTSIFTTTPKFDAATVGTATSNGIGQSASGHTAAVLAKTNFDAYDQIRFEILQVPTGLVDSATLETFWRPR